MTRLGIALLCTALVACDPPDPPAPAPQPVAISGTIAGGVPAGSKAILVFSVETLAGEGLYKWGEGVSQEGATYSIAVTPPPPSGALLLDGGTGSTFAIGFVSIVPSTLVVPDGPVADPAALTAASLGISKREAIVWRTGTFPSDIATWPNDFPEGSLSCGTCVDNAVGFDSYAPGSCSAVGVTTSLTDPSCNWT